MEREFARFRVYRVEDPVQFFEQLESPHQFGGRAPRPPRERTLLEKIHLWKHGWRVRILVSLRSQFTESPSAHLEGLFRREPPPQATPATKGTHYAEAPLLNSQQLVLSFQQPVRSHSRWENETVELPVKGKGVYLVEAVHGELRAYTIVMVSDVAMITKTAKGRLINFLVDRETGQPVPDAKIALLTRDRRLGEAQTNADGIAELKLAEARPDDLRIVGRRGGDFAVNTLASYSFGVSAEQWMGYVYTDRPVYRPGHTVHFKGILRLGTDSGYQVPAGRSVSVTVNDPEQKPVYQKTLTASPNGTIHDDLTLPPGAALGSYYMEVKAGDGFDGRQLRCRGVQKARVRGARDSLQNAGIGGGRRRSHHRRALFLRRAGERRESEIRRLSRPLLVPALVRSRRAIRGAAGRRFGGDNGDQLNEVEGRLDAEGKLTIALPTSVSEHKFDYRYTIEARVTDEANREIVGQGLGDRHLCQPGVERRGPSAISVRPEARPVSSCRPETTTTSPSHARAPGAVPGKSAAAGQMGSQGRDGCGDRRRWLGYRDVDIPRQGGSYRVRVTARTPEGREPEDFAYLWVSGQGGGDLWSGTGRRIQIVPDKKSYRAGETAQAADSGRPARHPRLCLRGRPRPAPVQVAARARIPPCPSSFR